MVHFAGRRKFLSAIFTSEAIALSHSLSAHTCGCTALGSVYGGIGGPDVAMALRHEFVSCVGFPECE